MPIDEQKALALEFAPFEVTLERGRLRMFAAAIGDTVPVHTDVAAARGAGHPDLLMPPTFLFSVELEAPRPFGHLDDLGIELATVLHGEQRFTYHRLVHAGDTLRVEQRIVSATAKTPAMDFLVRRSEFRREGELAATAETLTIVRHGGLA
ncbi:MaoC family dehydratase [Streptomyces sp. SID14478]|uniref:FAS1-like dehydratase domain-containing protein n=1 Tax=Streptomyces sp. SID14478 TaxID=2706073 RepID=UPI0013DD53DB|nr:MaoC family dehydratase N-terminal domain-containing protein [Streptomyces sp. SID14478]NEB79839.1 MaoC family dehydratase [Streptomyces sp. SID14478]